MRAHFVNLNLVYPDRVVEHWHFVTKGEADEAIASAKRYASSLPIVSFTAEYRGEVFL